MLEGHMPGSLPALKTEQYGIDSVGWTPRWCLPTDRTGLWGLQRLSGKRFDTQEGAMEFMNCIRSCGIAVISGFFMFLVFCLPGCSQLHIDPKSRNIPLATDRKLPALVQLYFTESFQEYVYTTQVLGVDISLDVGRASSSLFEREIARIFSSVVTTTGKAPSIGQGQYGNGMQHYR